MVHTYIKLPVHGELEHFTYISIASFICWKRKFVFMDPTGFAHKYKSPGIPDIYIKYKKKIKDEYGTRKYDQYAVIEIETHANTKDTEKKVNQFRSQAQNVEMIIIPMNKFDKWKKSELSRGKDYGDDIFWFEAYMSIFIPEGD